MSNPDQNPQPPRAAADEAVEDAATAVRYADLREDERVEIDDAAGPQASAVRADEGQEIEEDEATAVRYADLGEDERVDVDDLETASGAADGAETGPTGSASGAGSGSGGGGTSGGTAIGIDEHAIEKWTAEQQKVFQSVKQKVQELGIAKDDVERVAAFSVVQFMQEKDRRPDTRVDRVQAVNANGDVIVRMENMKYGDREPIINNDVRLKDAPAFEQSASQIKQANQRIENKSASEQAIAQHHQNEDTNQRERPTVLQQADDQVMARVQSAIPALTRGK